MNPHRQSITHFLFLAFAVLATPMHMAVGGVGSATPIVWSRDVRASIDFAQSADRPLMILVGSSPLTYEQLYEHGRRGPAINPFADPRVIEAARIFVPLQVPGGHGTAHDLLGGRVPARVNRVLVLLTPEGDILGQYGIAGSPENLAEELRLASRAYGRKLFETKLKTVLENGHSSEKTVGAVLRKIRYFEIVEADAAVISLAERPRLGAAVQRQAYETLANLSTSPATDYLVDRAVQGGRIDASVARRALEAVRIPAAAHLLTMLDADELDRRLVAYRALVRVLRISNSKADRFWEIAAQGPREQEIERVKRLAEVRLRALGEQVAGDGDVTPKAQPPKKLSRGRDREGRGQNP